LPIAATLLGVVGPVLVARGERRQADLSEPRMPDLLDLSPLSEPPAPAQQGMIRRFLVVASRTWFAWHEMPTKRLPDVTRGVLQRAERRRRTRRSANIRSTKTANVCIEP
jgi:hypothetical protein